jgi:hypothetical protein
MIVRWSFAYDVWHSYGWGLADKAIADKASEQLLSKFKIDCVYGMTCIHIEWSFMTEVETYGFKVSQDKTSSSQSISRIQHVSKDKRAYKNESLTASSRNNKCSNWHWSVIGLVCSQEHEGLWHKQEQHVSKVVMTKIHMVSAYWKAGTAGVRIRGVVEQLVFNNKFVTEFDSVPSCHAWLDNKAMAWQCHWCEH